MVFTTMQKLFQEVEYQVKNLCIKLINMYKYILINV